MDVHDLEMRVCDAVDTVSSWNLMELYIVLPARVKEEVLHVPVMLNENVHACYVWKGEVLGHYSMKYGFRWILNKHNGVTYGEAAAGALVNVHDNWM